MVQVLEALYVADRVDLIVVIGGVEEWPTVPWEGSIWLRKGGND